eukprot:SAG11_NODE_15297_length_582_cov_6.610766_1_plen_43_part_10
MSSFFQIPRSAIFSTPPPPRTLEQIYPNPNRPQSLFILFIWAC